MFSKKKKIKITIRLKLVIVSEKALQNSLSAVDGYENEHNPVDCSVNLQSTISPLKYWY